MKKCQAEAEDIQKRKGPQRETSGLKSPKALPSKRRQEFLREPGNFKAEVGKIPGRRDLSAEKEQKLT